MANSELYFAYGSNLDPVGMASRCPAAVVVGRARLADWRLAFRGVADVEPHTGSHVEGALWLCTPECIRSLDRYEGVSGGFYYKAWLEVKRDDGSTVEALVYVMNVTTYDRACMPSQGYLDTIVRGYAHFGLKPKLLRTALKRAQTTATRKATRWEDDGRKRLRPVDGPKRRKKASRRAKKALPPGPALGELTDDELADELVLWALSDPDSFTDDQLMEMGFSPSTIADLRLEQHGFFRGERVA